MHSNNAIKSLFKCYLLNGKTFQINISKYLQKILCWRITFLTRQCNGGITDELFWVEVGPILYWETTSHNALRRQWAVPVSPPAASRVFIKFELGLKSVISCLISGNRTHRIIPVQTTSPLPGDVTKLITTGMGRSFLFSLPWSCWISLKTDDKGYVAFRSLMLGRLDSVVEWGEG